MSLRSQTSLAVVKGRWLQLVSFSAWLIAAVGSFLTFSVDLSYGTTQGATIATFTQTLVAIVSGLTLLAIQGQSAGKRTGRGYFVLCLACFGLFAALMLSYVVLQIPWTCNFRDQTYVVGSTPTTSFKEYLAGPMARSECSAQLAAFQGNTLAMYDKAELAFRFVALGMLYMLAWSSLAILVVLVGLGLSASASRPHAARPRRGGSP